MPKRKLSDEERRLRKAVRKEMGSRPLHPQPCEVCGTPNADRHHDDYTKPREVRWLCRRHHFDLHYAEWKYHRHAKRKSYLDKSAPLFPESKPHLQPKKLHAATPPPPKLTARSKRSNAYDWLVIKVSDTRNALK